MSKISKSPERFTFQRDAFLERRAKEGLTPDNDPDTKAMADYYDSWAIRATEDESDPTWQKDNMEYDLRTSEWMLEKVRANKAYAQNLYAVMCNNEFTKRELWPILKEEKWSCSWRYAGGIIADMRQEGDYIDWYCSGIRNDNNYDPVLNIAYPNGYVPESVVTDEIESDLNRLGWIVIKYDDSKDI